MLDIVALANELGFSEAALISASDVVTSEELTALCNPEACRQYGSCWTCQPAAGPFEQLQEHSTSKDAGVVVQSIRDNVDFYEDWEILAETRAQHNDRLDKLADALYKAAGLTAAKEDRKLDLQERTVALAESQAQREQDKDREEVVFRMEGIPEEYTP